jgi:hypothetical protein
MSLTASVRTRRPNRHHHPVLNRVVLAVLRSPLHPLLDPGICELRYRGRRTGRAVSLPVLYAPDGDRLVVLVGDAAHKRWWRGFAAPAPVQVRRKGRVREGWARLLEPGTPDFGRVAAAYRRRQGLAVEATDRLLLIEPSGG